MRSRGYQAVATHFDVVVLAEDHKGIFQPWHEGRNLPYFELSSFVWRWAHTARRLADGRRWQLRILEVTELVRHGSVRSTQRLVRIVGARQPDDAELLSYSASRRAS